MRKLFIIFSDIKSLEIIRNIIRETLLANAMLVLIASEIIYINRNRNRNDWPYIIYIIAEPILATIGLTTIVWIASIINKYFQELTGNKDSLSFIIFFSWFLGTEFIILFNLMMFIQRIPA
ncbi:hypothetical protein QAA20_003245 [Salmonella enterica]|nr:hypothetical protein [Salmonella enterica]